VLLAVLTGIVGFASYMAATRANRETARTAGKSVDAAAFDRAKDIYLAALETARADLAACREDLVSTRADLLAARKDMRELTASNERLTVEIAALRAKMTG
jgi:hypothetical protein